MAVLCSEYFVDEDGVLVLEEVTTWATVDESITGFIGKLRKFAQNPKLDDPAAWLAPIVGMLTEGTHLLALVTWDDAQPIVTHLQPNAKAV